ncbi:MAG TPA: hypothetical protein VGZ22_17410 [Isosphaeraceae bacterium]|jgi:hypothetical protein|nr:hypothetical protein [Isosphaeraceae bacterium]
MKQLLKRILKALWRGVAPVRRPIVRKLDHHVDGLLTQAIHGQLVPVLHKLENAVNSSTHATQVLSYDMNLVLNSVVREVARLQMQIEILQHIAHDALPTPNSLSLVGEADDGSTLENGDGERMKVG